MPITTLLRYPLDPTGTNPNNRVSAEPHTLANRPIRAIAPIYGSFFEESISIIDVSSNTPLTSSQYRCVEIQQVPTARYGKAICAIILITDTNVSNNVTITYQCLGGEYSSNSLAVIDAINRLDLENRPVSWPNILNRPAEFDPAPHYHDAGDVYGHEYLVHAVERLRQAILIGDESAHDELRRYIDGLSDGAASRIAIVEANLAQHQGNTNNPHGTTKTHIGLGNVQDYPVATQAQAEAGSINTAYMTPLTTKQAITASNVSISQHISRTDNPHNTNKTHIGLGNVQDYPVATQAQAEAGSINTAYMTPLRVSEAISSLVGGALNVHISRTDNPHGTNKTHVGLGNVQDYGIASDQQAAEGTINTAYMTPFKTTIAITSSRDSGAFDNRYTRRNSNVSTSLREAVSGKLEAYVGGAWRQIYPPVWV